MAIDIARATRMSPPHRGVRPIDRTDPWTGADEPAYASLRSSPPVDDVDPWVGTHVAASRSAASRAPRTIDETDPWFVPNVAPSPSPKPAAQAPRDPASVADLALRDAIKAALDAGDVDRAAKLLEILRAKR
jgi:hypothetical protein